MRRTFGSILTLAVVACWPALGAAQTPAPPPSSTIDVSTRWEISLEGRVGFPTGYIRVDENEIHGRRLRFNDLGVSVSEVGEGSAAFWLTPRDAARASFLYYFLRGGSSLDRAVVFDGGEYNAGHVDANFDFWRASLAYERVLTSVLDRGRLIGSAGLTYVWLNAGLTQGGKTKAEDFYRQELPVPILGLRLEAPITDRLGIRAAVSGGLLPKSTVCARRAERSIRGRAMPTPASASRMRSRRCSRPRPVTSSSTSTSTRRATKTTTSSSSSITVFARA
jgi:hypothetical protein